MRKWFCFNFFILVLFCLPSQAKIVPVAKDANIHRILTEPNNKYIIVYDFDLNGTTLSLGSGSTLVFRGGSIKNGVLIGSNTTIKA